MRVDKVLARENYLKPLVKSPGGYLLCNLKGMDSGSRKLLYDNHRR